MPSTTGPPGEHHRGEGQRAVSDLLRRVAQGGERMARDLDRLLPIMDKTGCQSG